MMRHLLAHARQATPRKGYVQESRFWRRFALERLAGFCYCDDEIMNSVVRMACIVAIN